MMFVMKKRQFKQSSKQEPERGFVLATALVMLSLLTLLAVAMYYNSKSATQISSTAQHSTEGHYYAETAVNYMIWAYNNDAEFDNFDAIVAKSGGFNEPSKPSPPNGPDASTVGDREELNADLSNPGPTEISDTSDKGICNPAALESCQVMYFDNSPLEKRAICTVYIDPANTDPSPFPFSNCVNLAADPGDRTAPTLYQINTKLPRYIQLDISDGTSTDPASVNYPPVGKITPSIPVLINSTPDVPPYHNPGDVPNNGAIVWLTTGNSKMDFEVDPALNCTGLAPADAKACDANPSTSVYLDGWLLSNSVRNPTTSPKSSGEEDQYGVVVYAIGYVNGRPSSIIRAQIQ